MAGHGRTVRRAYLPPRAAASSYRHAGQARPGGPVPSILPPGGAEGPRPPTQEELAWLEGESAHFERVARSLGAGPDAPDVAQEAVKLALEAWGTWPTDRGMPPSILLPRWLVGFLFRAVSRNRYRVKRDSPVLLTRGIEDTARASLAFPEGAISARWALKTLQNETSPENWRAIYARYVEGLTATQTAHNEGRPMNTIYNRIRLARRDFRGAMARQEARSKGPTVRRWRSKRGA